ncbi:hypothetical protein B0H17DRAFT_1098129 [Mycena rosella]|uniref:Uncharacterized protein n=1 Tax=Mycena rosella TaxID=1033263 RepID=A0AAD7G138_MYCRO|nr:hypothetical protein B0H17DRAFT_1098129 [Mycena rosella]
MSSTESTLIDWTKSHITNLYAPHAENSGTDEAVQLQTDLDAAFAPDAEIRLNHTLVDREKLKAFVASRRAGKVSTEVECKPEDLIEAPVEEGNAEAGSIVAGKVTLIRTHKWRIRAAPAKTSTVILFSAKIMQKPSPQIVQLFQTSVDKPVQIVLPTVRHAEVDASAL